MRRLMLLRHAKSDWSKPGQRDHDRVLASRGREAAPRVGKYMATHGLVPELVICSTATRARETWNLVAPALRAAPPLVHDERIYENHPDVLLEVIRETAADIHVLLLVGHNPSFQGLAERLVATGDIESRQQLRAKFPTAGLAVIDFAVDAWDRVHPQSGRLDRMITPRLLDAEPD
jgi:phosphohistidine phosphatase